MTAGTQVSDLDGYFSLVGERLRAEGFAVSRSGRVGEYELALVASRRGGGIRESTTLHLLFTTAVDSASTRGLEPLQPEALIPFATAALDAQVDAASGQTVVVAIAVTLAGSSPRVASVLSSLQLKRGRCLVLPAAVDLSQSTVELIRRPEDLGRDGQRLLPYVWWLLVPRLIDRPRTRTRWTPARRIAAIIGVAAALMFGGAYVYVMREPAARHYLLFAADPASGRIAYMRHGPALAEASLVVVDAEGREESRAPIDPSAFLIGFDGANVAYLRCDSRDGPCSIFEASTSETHGTRVAEVRGKMFGATWSPEHDGFGYADRNDHEARLFHVDHHGQQAVDGVQAGDRDVAWLPDGRRIVTAGLADKSGLVLLESDGTRTILTPPGSGDSSARVSPDGRHVAYYRFSRRAFEEQAGRDVSKVWDLELLELSSATPRLLIQDICPSSRPDWVSPSKVVFGKWTGERCDLFVYDIEANESRQLVKRY